MKFKVEHSEYSKDEKSLFKNSRDNRLGQQFCYFKYEFLQIKENVCRDMLFFSLKFGSITDALMGF